MDQNTRLPAYPLLTSDPYVSVWLCADAPTQDDTRHWAGQRKRLGWTVVVDGQEWALLGRQSAAPAKLVAKEVTPTATVFAYEAGGVRIETRFWAPLLMDDFDLMSMPITYLELSARSLDGKEHQVRSRFVLHDDLCYDGEMPVPMMGDDYVDEGLSVAFMGRKRQNLLCHTGDHITIDWGYAYLAADQGVTFERFHGHWALVAQEELTAGASAARHEFMVGYDDVASIQYFGHIAKAWYARSGKTILDALHHCHDNRTQIAQRAAKLEEELLAQARQAGGEAYAQLVCASYRQSIAAHKLIADQEGKPVFLSKEDDSNGCIGTVDISYPSMPLFLLYAPELVRGMCRPVLHFASQPVWKDDFAPHDVGRYPYATGQVYGMDRQKFGNGIVDPVQNGDVFPPFYLYNNQENLYDLRYQMPVEECGNMILLLAAALRADGDDSLIRAYRPLLDKWVRYLVEYGEDPGEQLCTDDFAGHLAHNVNLAFKAVCGVSAYGWILEKLGEGEQAAEYLKTGKAMAQKVYTRAKRDGYTALTLDGQGWSLKYNAIWSILFDFDLFDEAFFTGEIAQYKKMMNTYGVPLDSRADYTKSDWILWVATFSGKAEDVEAFSTPIVKYLGETPSRVAFSDWYDTKTGRFQQFINRTVQGGLYMPLLRKKWGK